MGIINKVGSTGWIVPSPLSNSPVNAQCSKVEIEVAVEVVTLTTERNYTSL